MSRKEKDKEEEPPDGAFPWRPTDTWGIGGEKDEPEVILVDAGAGALGPKGRLPRSDRRTRGHRRQIQPRFRHDTFDRFTLALSASLAQARQRCEADGRRTTRTLVVEVRGGRHPLRDL